MTNCRIKRNNAERRLSTMRAYGWKTETIANTIKTEVSVSCEASDEAARNPLILMNFPMTRSFNSFRRACPWWQHGRQAVSGLQDGSVRMCKSHEPPRRVRWGDARLHIHNNHLFSRYHSFKKLRVFPRHTLARKVLIDKLSRCVRQLIGRFTIK